MIITPHKLNTKTIWYGCVSASAKTQPPNWHPSCMVFVNSLCGNERSNAFFGVWLRSELHTFLYSWDKEK